MKKEKEKKSTAHLYPFFRLKDDVKNLITTNPVLFAELMKRFKVSPSTLYRWLRNDDPHSTDWNFLILVWDFISESDEQYKKISDLLTIKNVPDVQKRS